MEMKKEEVLIEALPYIQKYEGKTFVIKYGGAAMTDPLLRETFGKDVTILRKIGINIVIVHGGGKEITEIAKRLGIETKFVNGQRYTDEAMVEVVQMVLAGKINKEIVNLINCSDGDAIGLLHHAVVDRNRRHRRKDIREGACLFAARRRRG